jgi:hypothetical protein
VQDVCLLLPDLYLAPRFGTLDACVCRLLCALWHALPPADAVISTFIAVVEIPSLDRFATLGRETVFEGSLLSPTSHLLPLVALEVTLGLQILLSTDQRLP